MFNLVSAFASFDLVPEIGFACNSCMGRYRLFSIPCDIPVHTHAYFVIPNGVIDGDNKEFSVEKGRFTVLLNGLQVPYMRTPTGFVLADAPRPGDYLWCEVIS